MSFAGEGVVTESNNGLGCAEDGTDGETDSNNRSRITRNVALEQMISGSDLSTYWSGVSDVSHRFFGEILLETSGEEIVRDVELMIQRDLRDGGRRGKVHTVDRKGSCQTVSKGKKVGVRRTLTYIDYCRRSTLEYF